MITRFAPSPTGPLHLGHAYSAMLAHDMAMAAGGTFLLRIEDIDRSRARPNWEAQIYDDLAWLGLSWETPVMRQSERIDSYQTALEQLWQRGVIYHCTCTRRDIFEAVSAPQDGSPIVGPDGIVYPGTCRTTAPTSEQLDEDYNRNPHDPQQAFRLHMALASSKVSEHSLRDTGHVGISYHETGTGALKEVFISRDHLITQIGDVVLARRGWGTSYHLSVVLDDAAQCVTHVVRGKDLSEATAIHVVLQRLLGLPTPTYHHHKLIRDDTGRRLAKRDDARAIALYRSEGASPADIRAMVGL